MKLTDEEKRMLGGEPGQPVKMAMEIVVAIGEIYGAEKLIPIKTAHIAGLSLKSHGIAGMEWVEDIAKSGAKVCVPTTLNVIGVDRSRDLKMPAGLVVKPIADRTSLRMHGLFWFLDVRSVLHGIYT